MAKKEKELDGLLECEKNAPTEFKQDYVDLYVNLILEKLKFAIGREQYAYVCSYLGRLYEIGAGPRADALIVHLRSLYDQKPALMKELTLAQRR